MALAGAWCEVSRAHRSRQGLRGPQERHGWVVAEGQERRQWGTVEGERRTGTGAAAVVVTVVLLLLGATAERSPAAAPGPTRPTDRSCDVSSAVVPESSGVVVSDLEPATVLTHDDSGDSARVFAVSLASCRVTATYALPVPMPTDAEDIALAPGHRLWLADIGDNRGDRASVRLIGVAEPAGGRPVGAAEIRTLHYPDGPHDAETLLASPVTGRLWIVTKVLTGVSGVYAVPPTGMMMTRVATVHVGLGGLVTGGDVRPDGRAVVLRTYDDAIVYAVPPGSTELGLALASAPVQRFALPPSPQGEGVAYARDGRSLVLTSESVGAPVWPLDLVAVPSTDPAASPTVGSPGPGTTTPSGTTTPGVATGTRRGQTGAARSSRVPAVVLGAAAALLLAGGVLLRRRVRRLSRVSR